MADRKILQGWKEIGAHVDVASPSCVCLIVIVLGKPDPERLTNGRLALEIEKFNVLNACLDQLFATIERAQQHSEKRQPMN